MRECAKKTHKPKNTTYSKVRKMLPTKAEMKKMSTLDLVKLEKILNNKAWDAQKTIYSREIVRSGPIKIH